ncbi:MAG: hypothetical protein AB7T49_09470 [Oligoflexales bacterium]
MKTTDSTIVDPWLPILKNLDLSRFEREVVKRYEKAPLGRSFLPISDILRKHRHVDEAVELLVHGVKRHPDFTVARVVLARELFGKGLVVEAWRMLKEATEPLGENVLAQKLLLKSAIILRLEDEVRDLVNFLSKRMMVDEETSQLIDELKRSDFRQFSSKYIQTLRESGLPVLDDYRDLLKEAEPKPSKPSPSSQPLRMPTRDAASPYRDEKIDGFFVAPLAQIFSSFPEEAYGAGGTKGVELDSTTLAEIYENQGHYHKALEIYRRMLKGAPQNEYVKQKIMQISKQSKEQRGSDLAIDPSLVDDMEALQIIDTQINFYNDILTRIKPQGG